MKFSLSEINPKFLAANAEALRAQGVDVSKLGLKVPVEKAAKRKTLAESRLEMANGNTIAAEGKTKEAVRGLVGGEIRRLYIDEVAEWPAETNAPRYRSKWEREWHEILKARGYTYCEFEPMSLNLAKGSRYTPDFITIEHAKDEHGRPVRIQTAWEVKGFWREAAKVRIKVAARLFPWLRFVAVKKRKKKLGGGWEEQVFTS